MYCPYPYDLESPWEILAQVLPVASFLYLFLRVFLVLVTFQGTNISPQNGILKMIFLFPRWDMLIPWRVYLCCLSRHGQCSGHIQVAGWWKKMSFASRLAGHIAHNRRGRSLKGFKGWWCEWLKAKVFQNQVNREMDVTSEFCLRFRMTCWAWNILKRWLDRTQDAVLDTFDDFAPGAGKRPPARMEYGG